MSKIGKSVVRLPTSYKMGDVIEVKTRIIHPNDSGRRKFKELGYIAAYYVQRIEAYYGEEQVLALDCSGAVSENPVFSFGLKATRNAPLKVIWKDSEGQSFENVIQVKV